MFPKVMVCVCMILVVTRPKTKCRRSEILFLHILKGLLKSDLALMFDLSNTILSFCFLDMSGACIARADVQALRRREK